MITSMSFDSESDSESATRQYNRAKIERWASLSEKIATAMLEASGKPMAKGKKPWEGWVHIRDLRNRTIRMKSANRVSSKRSDKHPESIWNDLLGPDLSDSARVFKSIELRAFPGPVAVLLALGSESRACGRSTARRVR